MPKAIHITTPWPDLKKEAKRLRIPKTRQKELRKIAENYVNRPEKGKNGSDGTVIQRSERPKHASDAG